MPGVDTSSAYYVQSTMLRYNTTVNKSQPLPSPLYSLTRKRQIAVIGNGLGKCLKSWKPQLFLVSGPKSGSQFQLAQLINADCYFKGYRKESDCDKRLLTVPEDIA